MTALLEKVTWSIKENTPEKGYELCFDKLMEDPDDSDALTCLGLLSMYCGNHNEAQWYFEQIDNNIYSTIDNDLLLSINDREAKGKWDNYRRLRNQHEMIRMAETASLCSGNVLEIGCANGDLSIFIASHGASLYGIDIDPIAVDLARHKTASLGIDNCRFQIGNGYGLELPDDMFDTVVVAEVLEHVDDPKKIIQEAYRICKSGGTVIISVPNGYAIPDPDHYNIFSRNVLTDLVHYSVGCSLRWNYKVPSQWIMGTFVKPGRNPVGNDVKDLNGYFLPQPYSIPKSEALVSVIVSTFNRKEFIADTIQSILNQTHKNIEIIVVDDGSVDPPKEELSPFMEQINYIYKANGGKSSALNLAIDHAKGEYIWVFDDDDIALPLKLELQLKRFQLNPNLGMVHTRSINFNDATHEIVGIHDLSPIKNKLNLKLLMRGCYVHGPTVLFKKSCLDQLKGWDTNLIRAQDYDFWLRLIYYYAAEYLPVPTVKYRLHSGSRGSKDEPVQFNEILSKTADYEKLIFKNLYHKFEIQDLYKDEFKSGNVTLMIEALIERATVYAARDLLDEVKHDMKVAKENSDLYGNPCFSGEAIQNIHQLAKTAVERKWDDHELVSIVYSFVNMITVKY
ncbi:glycosyltransferase [Bacillus sp. FSL K6-6540]|uniref:glycosyltransferase n=1 Tax=Bacillus sp. FSL K6-6540 TaxID=2921512 RepID=UPI0030FB5541